MHEDHPITLQCSGLVKAFQSGELRSVAVDEVSLSVREGEMALLMGPSGSGKSTLLAILSGLLTPDAGRVVALGEDIWSMTDTQREHFRLKNCGFIFQGYNLFAALTARQQLEMVVRWGEGASAREARRRAEEILTILGLARQMDLRPAQLSGGEKQRVAIGRALIKEPKLIFADEPTSALDWAHGESVVELLRNAAHENGATVVMVAHDARIIPYADDVYYLEDGRIQEGEDAEAHAPNRGPARGAPLPR
jgi:putative ABC transport system ATP-binding protein